MAYLEGSYSIPYVTLSILVAVVASYVALDLSFFASKFKEQDHQQKWSAISSAAMSLCIWAMHFIGMFSLRLPIPVNFHAAYTLVSLLIALAACFVAFRVTLNQRGPRALLFASVIMGSGISGMHYTGMAAMHLAADLSFSPGLVVLSILIAMSVSGAALSLTARMKTEKRMPSISKKLSVASIMGIAVSGMHYTGMAATNFMPNPDRLSQLSGLMIEGEFMVSALAAAAIALVFFPIYTVDFERRWSNRLSVEKELLQVSEARFRTLINDVADAIVVIDPNGRILIFNRGAELLFGYAQKEVIGENVSILMSEPDKSGHDAHIDRYLESNRSRMMNAGARELEARHKNGFPIPVEISISDVGGTENRQFIAVIRDMTAQKMKVDRLTRRANHDQLTGLYNRYMLWNRLEHIIQEAQREAGFFCIYYIDLDGLKRVNDTFGHLVGDELLKSVGAILRSIVRDSDVIARIGGDEFCIVIDRMHAHTDSFQVADKILAAFRQPIEVAEQRLQVTVSIGIALWPDDGKDGKTLLRNADAAMYAAKGMGKNNYIYYRQLETKASEE